MSVAHRIAHLPANPAAPPRWRAGLLRVVALLLIALAPMIVFVPSSANACACGCSVFDVGAGLLPQEDDHGGRIFAEYEFSDQTQNYVGSSKAAAALNSDKEIKTSWYNVGFSYNFNRDWGVMVRLPVTTDRSLTTDTGGPLGIQTYNSRSIGDVEIMGMYTGFFKDMSTGLMFGVKLPTGTFNAPGIDRDTQVGTGSTDLLVGGYHRGMLTGDNAWQYFSNILLRQPVLYQSAPDPQGFFDGNLCVVQTYHPGAQLDGAAGILYNNWYNVLGFDKITPLGQIIISHRDRDSGTDSDPLNSGFDRVMLSPGVEFTKVLDEVNKRVFKFYVDVEVPVYYRANSANNQGTDGQLVAPYLLRIVTSYNF